MTRDDVEEMVFSSDYRYCYVVGFDHWLRIIENHEQPIVIDRIGPFKFQITHIRRLDDETVFVSLELGEIYRVDLSNRCVSARRLAPMPCGISNCMVSGCFARWRQAISRSSP